jgi:hypothetical protein
MRKLITLLACLRSSAVLADPPKEVMNIIALG